MLELRPNCEYCDLDLPPGDERAMICSYECTFCAHCVERYLLNVCPTCGGELVRRPIRPAREWRPGSGLGLTHHPPSDRRRRSPWSPDQVRAMAAKIGGITPRER